MYSNIEVISLDAMHTLLFLKKSLGEMYLMALEKSYPLLKNEQKEKLLFPSFIQEIWKEAEGKLPPPFHKEHRDRYAHFQGENGFWILILKGILRKLSIPFSYLSTFLQKTLEVFLNPSYWKVEESFFPFVEKFSSYPLYVLSNWDSRLEFLLEKLGIRAYFQEVITSAKVGYEKPSPKIFAYLEKVASSSYILHIGDDWERDIKGALSYGFSACFFHKGEEKSKTPQVAKISSLIQLEEVLLCPKKSYLY